MSMTKIDLDSYQNFVSAVTSETSNQTDTLVNRLQHLATYQNLNPSLLLTASIGLSSEGGEFSEIVKKMIFQGKPFTEEHRFHMKRELGDILWYWTNACRALGYSPNDVVAENVKKLESRYPGGSFNPFYSENRAEGDL